MRLAVCLLLHLLALPAWADDRLWQRLAAEPNMVVLMRHAHAAGGDGQTWDESGNCTGESMLTPDGIALARRIGAAFAARGIRPVVVSSPMCRCRDTARIAFGSGFATDPALREIASADAGQADRFERAAQLLIARARGAAPVVFVSHRPNIDRLTLELVANGELLVGRVNARGEVDVLGRIELRP